MTHRQGLDSKFNNASVLRAFMHKDLQIYQTLQTNIQFTSWTVFTWMLEMVREKNSSLGSEKTVRPDDVSGSGCDFTGF